MTNIDMVFHGVDSWYWDTPGSRLEVLVLRLDTGHEVRIGINKVVEIKDEGSTTDPRPRLTA